MFDLREDDFCDRHLDKLGYRFEKEVWEGRSVVNLIVVRVGTQCRMGIVVLLCCNISLLHVMCISIAPSICIET